MNELMVHVESIVRPVRATQRRKLGMRRELLAHLQSALDEERDRDPGDALERAKRRLGVPGSLTAELQRAVPAPERFLLTRLALPRWLVRWGCSGNRRMFGQDRPLTTLHRVLLALSATLLPCMVAFVTALWFARPADYRAALATDPKGVLAFNVVLMGFLPAIAMAARGFVTRVGFGSSGGARMIWFGATVALLFAGALACLPALARRSATPAEIAVFAVVTLALLTAMVAAGRILAAMDRPYREWLALS